MCRGPLHGVTPTQAVQGVPPKLRRLFNPRYFTLLPDSARHWRRRIWWQWGVAVTVKGRLGGGFAVGSTGQPE